MVLFRTHMISGPSDMQRTDQLHTTCGLRLSKEWVVSDDVNWRSAEKFLVRVHNLRIRSLISPTILTETITTSENAVTQRLRSGGDYVPRPWQLNYTFRSSPLTEGLLMIKYAYAVGEPAGWSSVFMVYSHFDTFVARSCVSHRLNDEKETDKSVLTVQYGCVLLRECVGCMIYAVHYPDAKKNKSNFEQEFFPHVANFVKQKVAGVSNQQISLPKDARGDYKFVLLNVRWRSAVNIGDFVQMHGFLGGVNSPEPECLYGYYRAEQPLHLSKNFLLKTNNTWEYFVLYKHHVRISDTGFYKCVVSSCQNCSTIVGFEERLLEVLPDSSMLQLKVEREAAQEPRCRRGDISTVRPGEELRVICSHTVALGAPTDRYHTITHGFVNDSVANGRISNLVIASVTNKVESITLLSTGLVRVPNLNEPFKQWYIQCYLVENVAHNAYGTAIHSSTSTGNVRKEIVLDVVNRWDPVIIAHSVETGAGRVVHQLANAASRDSGKEAFMASGGGDNGKLIEEDVFKVVFTADVGLPKLKNREVSSSLDHDDLISI
ncbi:unnamed protein product, partial [Dicrocoelium dendriticum]